MGGPVRGISLFFLRAGLVPRHAPALRQKPEHCLIADTPLEHIRQSRPQMARPLRARAVERWGCAAFGFATGGANACRVSSKGPL